MRVFKPLLCFALIFVGCKNPKNSSNGEEGRNDVDLKEAQSIPVDQAGVDLLVNFRLDEENQKYEFTIVRQKIFLSADLFRSVVDDFSADPKPSGIVCIEGVSGYSLSPNGELNLVLHDQVKTCLIR